MNKREKTRMAMLLGNLGREIVSMQQAHRQLTDLLEVIDTDTTTTPVGLARRADEAAAGCASAARFGFREISQYARRFIKEEAT